MKKSNTQKGITLVALVITITVMLTLLGVVIQTLKKDGVLGQTRNSVETYEDSEQNEQLTIGNYVEYIDESILPIIIDNTGRNIVGQKVNATTEAWDENNQKLVIPAGFKITVDGQNVKEGIVIEDENGNQFVWIPVKNLNEFARIRYNERYDGVSYNFSGIKATEKTSTDEAEYNSDLFQIMVKSVKEYGGFYVGRYEMSINDITGKAQSVSGVESATANVPTLRNTAKTYSESGSGVVSDMIYGCQYDAMIRWMQENNIDATKNEPTDTNRNVTASRNTTKITGSADSNDILNNIYDLLGSRGEVTQRYREDMLSYGDNRMVYDGVLLCYGRL